MSLYRDRIDYSVLPLFERDFFAANADIADFTLKIGDTWVRGGRLSFATWAGPTADLFNLAHEMAHLVEIDDARCHIPGFGFKLGKEQYVGGQLFREMFTPQAIQREIRTLGIQLVMMREYDIGIDRDVSYHEELETWGDLDLAPSTVGYMAALCKWIDGMHHYHPKNRKDYPHGTWEELAFVTITRDIEEEASKWSMDSIIAEWDRKMQTIRERKAKNCWKHYADLD